jgi:hypothetical protein
LLSLIRAVDLLALLRISPKNGAFSTGHDFKRRSRMLAAAGLEIAGNGKSDLRSAGGDLRSRPGTGVVPEFNSHYRFDADFL